MKDMFIESFFKKKLEFVNLVSEEPHFVTLRGKCSRAAGTTIIFANLY
jgi:hypothetical protein